MPEASEPILQARHNESAAGILAGEELFDWAVTALFYAALHEVQAYLIQLGSQPASHTRREVEIGRHPEILPILDLYRQLRTHSENVRYDCRMFSADEFEDIREQNYQAIIRHIQGLQR